MKLYVAGAYAANFGLKGKIFSRLTENEQWQRRQVKYILESYHYVYRKSFVEKMRADGRLVALERKWLGGPK